MTPNQMFSLAGKRALVTGGSSGIGFAIARAFGQAGAHVVLSGHIKAEVVQAAHAIGATGLTGDLSSRQGAEAVAQGALSDMGGVDILVSCAGIEGPVTGSVQTDEAAYRQTFNINLHAATWLCGAVLPQMQARRAGVIVLVSSLSAMRGNRAIGAYAMTKAALAQLARNIAVEYGPDGVRANAIAPGLIDTPFSRGLISDADFMARRMRATPLRRVGLPEEIAATALWLASAGGGFVTGQTIVVDGGTLISDGS